MTEDPPVESPTTPAQAPDASDAPAQPAAPSFLRSLAGKWQLPVLILGLLLLLTSLPRLTGKKPPINIDDQIAQARQALQDNRPADAVVRIESLLAAPMNDAQRSQVVLIRGLAHYSAAAMSRDADQRSHARQAITDFDRAAGFAGSVEALDSRLIGPAEFYIRKGQARQWAGDTGESDLLDGLKRLGSGSGPEPLRRQAIELLCDVNPAVVLQQLDSLLAQADLAPETRLWATRRKAQLLVRQDRLEEAEQMLNGFLAKLPPGASQDALEIQLARVHYEACQQQGSRLTPAEREARLDQAYLLLSAVRQRRTPVASEPEIDAELFWLLGEVNFIQDRPKEAEEAFLRVVHEYADSTFGRAARLGVAKSEAAYNSIERAYESYCQVVEDLQKSPADPLIDRHALQDSLWNLSDQLRLQERWEPACQFLALLYPMVDPSQTKPSPADIKQRQGQLLRKLALEEKQSAERLSAGTPVGATQPEEVVRLNAQARQHLGQAAEAFLETARLVTADDERSGGNLELAADCYDEAGELMRAIVVLRKFIKDSPTDRGRVARAVFSLAKAYQGAGQYEQAVAQYKQMTSEYRNSPDANKSQVPMALCYKALGQLDEAEKVLSGILADDQRYSPEGNEYKQALFELSKLLYERRQYRLAIARFDEALQRDPDSPQALYCRYYLADSYRLSGIELDATIRSAKTPLERSQLTGARTQWLRQAREEFDRVVAAFESRGVENSGADAVDWLYLRNSYFFRADCLFDLGLYSEAIDRYDLAALKYHGQPEAVAAYVQIVTCYQRMGLPDQARAANERAKWLLKKLPAEAFARRPLPLDKDYFARWLESVGNPDSSAKVTLSPGGGS